MINTRTKSSFTPQDREAVSARFKMVLARASRRAEAEEASIARYRPTARPWRLSVTAGSSASVRRRRAASSES